MGESRFSVCPTTFWTTNSMPRSRRIFINLAGLPLGIGKTARPDDRVLALKNGTVRKLVSDQAAKLVDLLDTAERRTGGILHHLEKNLLDRLGSIADRHAPAMFLRMNRDILMFDTWLHITKSQGDDMEMNSPIEKPFALVRTPLMVDHELAINAMSTKDTPGDILQARKGLTIIANGDNDMQDTKVIQMFEKVSSLCPNAARGLAGLKPRPFLKAHRAATLVA